MKRRRIYILPTKFGLVFITGSFLMILIGSAYQNNLVNMLSFFMLSLVFVCMIQTHGNLKDVRLESLESEGGFAGTSYLVSSVLANDARVARYNIESRMRGSKEQTVYENRQTISGRGTLKIRSAYPAKNRGRYRVVGARVSTVFPLGLFEAWTWFKDAVVEYSIYPEPLGERPIPIQIGGAPSGEVGTAAGGDDFHGHRKFHGTDSYRHVDWKAHARGRPLLIKEFTEGEPQSLILDWAHLPGLGDEERLSQLSKWIEIAKTSKLVFGLRIPGQTVPPGQGLGHAIRCWEALARYQSRDDERSKTDHALS